MRDIRASVELRALMFLGTVSGARVNQAASVAFALRDAFPWQRVPAYILTQFAGVTGIGR